MSANARENAQSETFMDMLDRFALWVERDRHEPDKLLCHVASMRRQATDLRLEAELEEAQRWEHDHVR